MRLSTVMSAAVLMFVQQACKSDSPTTPASINNMIVRAVTPTQIDGIVGSVLQDEPVVEVVSAVTQRPLKNIEVRFTGASVTQPVVLTDANGIATPGEWRFGTTPRTERLSVWIGNELALQFAARLSHDVPAHIYAIGTAGSDEVVALAGHSVPAFQFQIADRFWNPVTNLGVEMSVTSGAIEKTKATTDANGRAFTGKWLLDDHPGTAQLVMTASGMEPKVFTGYGVDSTTLRWYSLLGDNRSTLGVTKLDTCLCGDQDGFFIERLDAETGDVAEQGGKFRRTDNTLRLTTPFLSGRIKGDTLSVEKFAALDVATFDPVYVTRVYVIDRNR